MDLARCLFFLVDILLFFLGFIIVGIGVWLLTDQSLSSYIQKEPITATTIMGKIAYVLIFLGCTVLFFGFLGLLSIVLQSAILVCALASICIIPIVMILVILGLAWYVAGSYKIRRLMEEELLELWTSYNIFRNIEIAFRCCGVRGPQDYTRIPDSCRKKPGVGVYNTTLYPNESDIQTVYSHSQEIVTYFKTDSHMNNTDLNVSKSLPMIETLSKDMLKDRNPLNIDDFLAHINANKSRMDGFGNDTMSGEDIYTTGCLETLKYLIFEMSSVIFGLSTAILVMMGAALILACFLRTKFSK